MGRTLDSNFKVHFFNFLGFKFQSNFLGFIFQNGPDSGFKFQIGGIQDSDLGLQGPISKSVTTNQEWFTPRNLELSA